MQGEVLVAILNNQRDFGILQEEAWYRVPVDKAPRRWPPRWLAFYQTKIFDEEKYAIHYYGRVQSIETVRRYQLFPQELPNSKSERQYYKVTLETLHKLSQPIRSRKPRRIVFVPTTWAKFSSAKEFNDLFDESPLEDLLWQQMQRLQLGAERQWRVSVGKDHFYLDFAIFCNKGEIDVETDGDTYHIGRQEGQRDRKRNNALATAGWQILRFDTQELHERMETECVPKIVETVGRLGGLRVEGEAPRRFYPVDGEIQQQLSLFDDADADNASSDP